MLKLLKANLDNCGSARFCWQDHSHRKSRLCCRFCPSEARQSLRDPTSKCCPRHYDTSCAHSSSWRLQKPMHWRPLDPKGETVVLGGQLRLEKVKVFCKKLKGSKPPNHQVLCLPHDLDVQVQDDSVRTAISQSLPRKIFFAQRVHFHTFPVPVSSSFTARHVLADMFRKESQKPSSNEHDK